MFRQSARALHDGHFAVEHVRPGLLDDRQEDVGRRRHSNGANAPRHSSERRLPQSTGHIRQRVAERKAILVLMLWNGHPHTHTHTYKLINHQLFLRARAAITTTAHRHPQPAHPYSVFDSFAFRSMWFVDWCRLIHIYICVSVVIVHALSVVSLSRLKVCAWCVKIFRGNNELHMTIHLQESSFQRHQPSDHVNVRISFYKSFLFLLYITNSIYYCLYSLYFYLCMFHLMIINNQ